ncbi:ribonuclease H-like domain-containing protein [Astrocystis sublimbata]|nr:ribonuclease H-like domain-containing protein [Astrocystis sublimbata]
MVYVMQFTANGGCRNYGYHQALGAAVCCHMRPRWYVPDHKYKSQPLPVYPTPPNKQRAEITAVFMALQWAWEKYRQLEGVPKLKLRIYSDSRYAIGCMNDDDLLNKWKTNGWLNARGCEVANRDLIEQASHLDIMLKDFGSVQYIWIPRSENWLADQYCDEALDAQETETFRYPETDMYSETDTDDSETDTDTEAETGSETDIDTDSDTDTDSEPDTNYSPMVYPDWFY